MWHLCHPNSQRQQSCCFSSRQKTAICVGSKRNNWQNWCLHSPEACQASQVDPGMKGSLDVFGWSLKVMDSFEVPNGNVVIVQVLIVRRPPAIQAKSMRPRSPSRSPKRKPGGAGIAGIQIPCHLRTTDSWFGFGDLLSVLIGKATELPSGDQKASRGDSVWSHPGTPDDYHLCGGPTLRGGPELMHQHILRLGH